MTREELLKNAKPILFNTEMVKAILEDRKTVTRRVIKLKHMENLAFGFDFNAPYQVGDILYVRETWKPHDYTLIDGVWSCSIEYKVGESLTRVFWKDGEDSIYENTKWYPSIHLPKEAARIFLKVTNVRVERLQDITEEESKKEGCIPIIDYSGDQFEDAGGWDISARILFSALWDSTINKQDLDEYGWEANPYVWVIDFEKVEYD